ncbi:MAG: hypothetical protein JKY22_05425 [Flavobacteriaceae bacterium]|nr:hypothetical protein [Flavobacteriaceae bacterium]
MRLSYADLDLNGSIDPNTEILQERNNYPFGLEHRGYNNVIVGTENNHITFQGQEISKELGYNMHEFKFRHYDATTGRFVVIDPLAEDYSYQSPYNFAENQVIDGFELEGLEKVDAKFGVKLNLNIGGAGTNVNASVAFGLSSRIGAFQPSANISATFYNGGLGTTSLARGFQRDVVASGALTVGGGNASPVGLNTFNPNTASGVQNTFKNSGTIGTNFVFNSSGRNQQVGFAGARFGDVSIGTHNDFGGFKMLGLSDGQDRFHTGGGFLSIGTNDSSFQGTLSFNVFTAMTNVNDGLGSDSFTSELLGGSPVNVNSFSLNQGSTSFSFRSNNFTGGFSTLGRSSMFSQNGIHKLINFHLIPSTTKDTFNVSGGFSNNQ